MDSGRRLLCVSMSESSNSSNILH